MRGHKNSSDLPLRVFHHTQLGDVKFLKKTLKELYDISPNDAASVVNIIDPLTTDSPLMMACRKGDDLILFH